MSTKKVQDLTNLGVIQTGDKLVGERVTGTTVLLEYANDITLDTAPVLGGNLGLGAYGIIGTATNDSAAAGNMGQFASSVIAQGAPVSIGSGGATNITSLSLTAGDWFVWGNTTFLQNLGVTNLTQCLTYVSNATAGALPGAQLYSSFPNAGLGAGGYIGLNAPAQRFSLASTTTIYLISYAAFSVSATIDICGGLYARRIR